MEFVQEAVGQVLPLPNLFYDPIETSDTPISANDCNINFTEKRKKLLNSKPATIRRRPQSFTINVNYVYGSNLDVSTTSINSSSLAALPNPSCTVEYSPINLTEKAQSSNLKDISSQNLNSTRVSETAITDHNTINNSLPDSTINSAIDLTQNNKTSANDCPVITYNFDWRTKTLQPEFDITTSSEPDTYLPIPVENKTSTVPNFENKENNCYLSRIPKISKKLKTSKKIISPFKLHKRIKQKALAYREKRHLKRRCEELITTYSSYLENILLKFKDYPLIQYYYRHFKALELYTYLLKGIKITCSENCTSMSNISNNSPSNLKRTRNSNSNTEDDNSPFSARQVRKLNRQEENFRHMLLPDTPEEANRKDASKFIEYYY